MYMMLYTSLLYNTTPIHCTPLPLHPPLMNTQASREDLTKATYSIKVGRKDGRDVTLFNLDTPGAPAAKQFWRV